MSKVEELKKRIEEIEFGGGKLHIDWADGADINSEEAAEEVLRMLNEFYDYQKLPERTRMLLTMERLALDLREIMDTAKFETNSDLSSIPTEQLQIRSKIFGIADMALLDLSNWENEIDLMRASLDRP